MKTMSNSLFDKELDQCHPAPALSQRHWLTGSDSGSARWGTVNSWLVLLMQLKDTVAIILLLSNGLLLFGIVGGVGIPGLVLYWLRWRQARQPVAARMVAWVAGLSLCHEVLWAWTFFLDATRTHSSNPDMVDLALPPYASLYWAGAVLCAGQLLVLVVRSARWQQLIGMKKSLLQSVLWFVGILFARYVLLLVLREQVPPVGPTPDFTLLLWVELGGLAVLHALLWYGAVWQLGPIAFALPPAAEAAETRWQMLRWGWLGWLLLYQTYTLYSLGYLVAYVLAGGTNAVFVL